ncbi:MAG: YraN family protein [Saprospiraceae bacterium]|nr:YraN family protein [Saprospiraceae bacterium]
MEVEIQEIKQLLKELVLSQKETDIKFKETDKRIKAAFDLFEGQWGKLMESLVEGDLIKLLQAKGINVHDTSMRRKGVYEGNNYEFDIIAHNGTEIVIVEVKTTLKTQDVKAFVQKLKQVRVWLDEYKNYTVYGAIAFLRADSGSEMFAQSEKLFVIKATGNSAMIINTDDFVPKKF